MSTPYTTATNEDFVPDIITSDEGKRNFINGRRLALEQYERDRRALANRLYREFAEQQVQAAQQEAQQ